MFSVVIVSHNGAGTLTLTLDALERLALAAETVEIIAVDNASTDGTRNLLERYRGRLPMAVLSEPRQGKSFALNRALEVVRGDLVVFIDDDVLPEPQWLEAYVAAAERLPEVDLFAGQVRHHWQKQPPQWLLRLAAEGRSYAGTPIDQPEGPVPVSFFKGVNFMVRRRVIDHVRFSERPEVNFLGTYTSSGGEDTAFISEALGLGYQTHYVLAACVKHIVRPAQVGILPVFQRYVRIGRSMVLTDPQRFGMPGTTFMGYPRYLFRIVPRDALRALRYWAAGDSYAAANEMVSLAMICGRAQQWRRQAGLSGRGGSIAGLGEKA